MTPENRLYLRKMNPNSNILQELQELNSSLSAVTAQTPYIVPNGYFEELLEQVMRRIKALEAANAGEELAHLSPLLSRVSKQMPYTVPAGYFENVEDRMAIAKLGEISAKEEIEALSPLLSGLKKITPYSIPAGYFETVTKPAIAEKPAARVVSMASRKWFRLAAAAVVTGVIILTGLLVINKDKATPATDSYTWLKKNTKKVSSEKIDEFIQLTDEEKLIKEAVASSDNKSQEVKELLKDISEEEIQVFLNETKVLDDLNQESAADEMLLN